jgi:hypothetical protein
MPTVTPTLNLPQAPLSASAFAKTTAAPAVAPPAPAATPAASAPAPSATVTLSPQALSAMAAASRPASPSAAPASSDSSGTPVATHDVSMYESLKNGISSAVSGVEDAISSGAHAVVDGVETAVSTAHDVAKGIVELPFAAVSRACDAAGALIDKI